MPELNLVERVIALEAVELLETLAPEHLATMAMVASEVQILPGSTILEANKPVDALYIILDGSVELIRDGSVLGTASQNAVLGAWALFDEDPALLTVRALTDTHLLRVGREDFHDLLANNSDITNAMFSTLVKRFRKFGMKTIVRLDSGEEVTTEAMTDGERQKQLPLPQASEQTLSGEFHRFTKSSAAVGENGGVPTVVVIDDNQADLAKIKKFLEANAEFDVRTFTDFTETERFFESHRVDVAISDCRVANTKGLQLLKRLKEIQPESSRMLLTGCLDIQIAAEAINQISLFQYVEKPWKEEQLLFVVRSGAERSRLLHELREKIEKLDSAHITLKTTQQRLIEAFL